MLVYPLLPQCAVFGFENVYVPLRSHKVVQPRGNTFPLVWVSLGHIENPALSLLSRMVKFRSSLRAADAYGKTAGCS